MASYQDISIYYELLVMLMPLRCTLYSMWYALMCIATVS